jgi:hypothetical protein
VRPATCTSAVLYRHPLAHAVHPNLVCGKLTQSFQDHSFGAPHSRVALCVTSFRWVGIPSDRTRTTFSPLRRIALEQPSAAYALQYFPTAPRCRPELDWCVRRSRARCLPESIWCFRITRPQRGLVGAPALLTTALELSVCPEQPSASMFTT